MNATMRKVCLGLILCVAGVSTAATTNVLENGDPTGGWTTDWKPIMGINDGDDGQTANLDFVGDSDDWGGYWDSTETHVFFRMRVDADDVATNEPSGAHIVAINVLDQDMDPATKHLVDGTDGKADYGFAWDSKSNSISSHGLEMMVRTADNGPAWSQYKFDDIDGNAGKKLTNDINGDGRSRDGYLRTIDGTDNGSTDSDTIDALATTNFGDTSFIDIAVTWDYLEANTDLERGQGWEVTFASIAGATDHNAISEDVAGGVNPSDFATAGFSTYAVPEPTTLCLLALGGVAIFKRRRS
ncbi:MAG: PEP-CTERM sorting domain-containing protein [Phycisphaerales bacterium]|jgi:hypothetical protein|nr:PEP-CTERM sorting domain-containing protein [Phycisphaerales bacterium]MBT7171484.1 PEP-CTERM sorting domain-containing protein [Phycisphaerales bacterium]